jgi:2-polyprenyl-6-methoxyphenol hydroxylase-like FAD-dependent oxidoreductase
MKLADPSHDITVLERDPRGATFGFGVVFSETTLGGLAAADPQLDARLAAIGVRWTDIEVRHRGERLRAGGNGFAAAPRKGLLALLEDRALELGVEIRHESPVADHAALLAGNDLVVGCDGLGSGCREAFRETFRPSVEVGRAKYIWFATSQPFDALTFVFAESEHGWFGAHAYPFEDGTSTFIVETDEATWRRAGLDATGDEQGAPGASDERAMRYVAGLFADTLGGHPLIGNASRWANFRTVRNGCWHHENLVLIGDAAHTAHFSVGSGTKMAMEDAVALAGVLTRDGMGKGVLAVYEAERRPGVERIQDAAHPSLAWWERFPVWTRFDPAQFTYHFMTRSQRVGHENLRMRDRRFVRRVEAAFAERHAGMDQRHGALSAPLSTGALALPNRVGARVVLPADVPLESLDAACAIAAPAWSGAGLVSIGAGAGFGAATCADWGRIRALVRRRSDAAVSARLRATDPAALAAAAQTCARAGIDLVELIDLRADGDYPAAQLAALREAPDAPPVMVELTLPSRPLPTYDAAVRRFAARCRADGVAAVSLRLEGAGGSPTEIADRLAVADAIRNEIGLPACLSGGIRDREELLTAVIAGRADLGCGTPSLLSGAWTVAR